MKNLFLFCTLVLFSACQQESSNMEMALDSMQESMTYSKQVVNTSAPSIPESANSSSPTFSERKVIKTGDLKYQVEDLDQVTQQVDSLCRGYGGYIASMNQDNDHYAFRNQLLIKIPANHFSLFLNEVDQRSIYLDHKRINTQDVSEEFVDITARIKTKKAVRDRFTEVLRSKANSVEEILHAENQIRVIQEEIESIEQRINYLTSQSAMSTINLDIYQKVEFVKAPEVYSKTYFAKLGESFMIGGKVLEKLSLFLIALWPLLMLGIPIYVFRKNIFRRVGAVKV